MKRDHSRPLGVPDVEPVEAARSDPNALARSLAQRLFRTLVRRVGSPPIEFALAGGRILHAPDGAAVGRVVFRDARVLWDVLCNPELAFGDAYSAGRVEIHGNLFDVLYELYCSSERVGASGAKRSLFGWMPRARTNSLDRSREHIQHHYDLGNDFYALWLDEQMVYTCAYYPSPDATLEQAQVAKLEHVCRKLELEPGMEVIEAGCGWGALALHMAREHGVRVRAFNISSEQIAWARERARREGLDGRVEFIHDDYRNIPERAGRCDAFVSIGMLEHVGADHYRTFSDVIADSLAPHGRALVHSVGRSRPQPPNAWLERRIFPGSYPPSLREMMDLFEPHRFCVVDVENLRLHYAKTLLAWLERFDVNVERIRARYGEAFVRAWRLYLAGCAAAFRSSSIQLYQVLFTHAENNDVSLSRRHLYDGGRAVHWREF